MLTFLEWLKKALKKYWGNIMIKRDSVIIKKLKDNSRRSKG